MSFDPAVAFIARSREYLSNEYLPKIRACVGRLSDEELWSRPNEASNSVANLLLHLAGNLRQWIVSGVGGAPDTRARDAEFATRGGLGRGELLAALEASVAEADAILAALPAERLAEQRLVQQQDVTVLDAIYHAVEHFAGHTYQIAYITKATTGEDLGFYRLRGGVPEPSWPPGGRATRRGWQRAEGDA
ncbi:MAG: DUF1572 family protein [Longimicrobiales bacterium]